MCLIRCERLVYISVTGGKENNNIYPPIASVMHKDSLKDGT